ncbi:BglG family transcription antiterminator [Brevibacillus fulvus]|uniref:Ascorbate-specific PTS system EIIA component n=1 Tax=Brevibacillus fulvus TaxID=1125967 RepID=A0A938Y0Z9_9BACL|nr:BglG family transcription antiterminator [Brevibacillus fulvus]MBM7589150.1 transcriptional antiterminator/mannitol/fructose-specific phosphotransferase system IIA component (Ntr-type) [Brevibacillus fulvus]
MQLDDQSYQLLKEILISPVITVKDLQERYGLTRSQIHYRLQKITDWLAFHQLPPVRKSRTAGIIVDPAARDLVSRQLPTVFGQQSILTEPERITFLLLMLLSRNEELSLQHFASGLKVSRNTVLADLKRLNKTGQKYQLSLQYTRRNGYTLLGEEWTKRMLLIELVQKALKIANGEEWLLAVTGLSKAEVKRMRSRFEIVEKRLKIRFTDEKLMELPLTFLLLLRRIKRGKQIELPAQTFAEVSRTKEYQAVDSLFWDLAPLSEQDRLFLTLQLLSSSLSFLEVSLDGNDQLQQAIEEMVTTFEKLACVTFQQRSTFLEKLYQHVKPAVYRIVHALPVENPLLLQIKKEHGDVYHLVQKSMEPLAAIAKRPFPEEEIAYLTILIAGWLQKQGEKLSSRLKAIVVCPNGISVSKLLLETLREMFPEFVFLDHIPVREFASFPLEFELVFSTVPLRTEKKLFLIKPLFSALEKRQLKMRVYQEIYGCLPPEIDYDGLLQVIEQHAEVKNAERLKQSLRSYLGAGGSPASPTFKAKPNLADLLTEETIVFQEKVSVWHEAIRLASLPLLASNSIEPRYVEMMIRKFDRSQPYIVIAPRVAIPHASPEDGVNRLTMSLLRLSEGVEFADGLPVNLVIVLAAIDRKTHLTALLQLNELVADQENVSRCIAATNKRELLQMIREYSREEVCG